MEQNKTGQYLKYAVSEIILVVIGILIALSISNWNESNNQSKKETALLAKLKSDLNSDIEFITSQDSLYSELEGDAELGIKMFYMAKSINDIDSVSKLTNAPMNDLYINNSTYDEMVNSGSMYNLKNKNLQAAIINHYLMADSYKYYIRQIIDVEGHLVFKTPETIPYSFLIDQLMNPQIDLHSVDTSWINNPKSPTYLAVIRLLEVDYNQNIVYRRRVFKTIMESSKRLIAAIDEELEHSNK